jgi:hypothetical protein
LASASPAFHNVGGVLHQLRYVRCAASLKAATRVVVPLRGKKKRRGFASVSAACFLSSARVGERLRVLVKARSGRNTRTSVFLGVPCNHRPTETRFRWAIVDGERVLFTQKMLRKSVPYVGLKLHKSLIFNII